MAEVNQGNLRVFAIHVRPVSFLVEFHLIAIGEDHIVILVQKIGFNLRHGDGQIGKVILDEQLGCLRHFRHLDWLVISGQRHKVHCKQTDE